MGYKAYEKLINLGLMWQMKDMIAKATGVKPLGVSLRKPLFKRRNVLESMEIWIPLSGRGAGTVSRKMR